LAFSETEERGLPLLDTRIMKCHYRGNSPGTNRLSTLGSICLSGTFSRKSLEEEGEREKKKNTKRAKSGGWWLS
jgi:hypothetical protein